MTPLSFLHHGGRACGGMSCIRFLGKWRQREREGKKLLQRRGRKIFLPCLCVSAGRRWQTVPSKQHRLHLLFLTVHETVSFCTKHVVSFKRKWRQNMSHFNQVLNCNFIFKNQFNCISAKFKCQP